MWKFAWMNVPGMGVQRGESFPNTSSLLGQSGARAFIDRGKGLCVETAQSALTVISKSVVWPPSFWLFSVQLIFCPRAGLFPFPWGQFSELWQLLHAYIWSPCSELLPPHGGFSVCDSSRDMAQSISHGPWGGTKGPWLCLLTIIFVGLFSFVLAFSHLFDYTHSLAKGFSTD